MSRPRRAPRPGEGRPPLPPEERRKRVVAARFTEAEFARLSERAEEEGVTVSEAVHDAAEEWSRRQR